MRVCEISAGNIIFLLGKHLEVRYNVARYILSMRSRRAILARQRNLTVAVFGTERTELAECGFSVAKPWSCSRSGSGTIAIDGWMGGKVLISHMTLAVDGLIVITRISTSDLDFYSFQKTFSLFMLLNRTLRKQYQCLYRAFTILIPNLGNFNRFIMYREFVCKTIPIFAAGNFAGWRSLSVCPEHRFLPFKLFHPSSAYLTVCFLPRHLPARVKGFCRTGFAPEKCTGG